MGAKTHGGPWWLEPEGAAHERLVGTAARLKDEDKERYRQTLKHMRLFGGRNLTGLEANEYFRAQDQWGERSDAITWNICHSMGTAVQAKIAKNKPTPQFLTENADWSKQQRAKNLTKFVQGVFYANHAYEMGQDCFLDAVVDGSGVAKVFGDRDGERGRIGIERVFPWELYVDPVESLYGSPRTLYQCKLVDRGVLKALFPKHADAIDKAEYARGSHPGRDVFSDQVQVWESWHLPSRAGADDGRHVIAIDKATLDDRPWKRTRFPFAHLRWEKRRCGYWGQGLIELLVGLQVEINSILMDVEERFRLCSKAMMLIPRGAKIVKSHIVNENGIQVEYTGDMPPQIVAFSTVAPEVFQHLERLYQRAYEIAGVSQLSASSKKPTGLDSGAALREYNDIESERFVLPGQAYENFFMDLAALVIDEARELHEAGVDLEVASHEKRRRRSFIQKIRWADVNLDEDAYEMKVFPTSALPSTPAGRTATVEQWITAGFISREQGMALLDFPDIDQAMSLELAAYEVVLDAVEMMIEDGEYIAPEPYENVALSHKLVQAAYLRAKLDRVPGERLQLLRDHMTACEDLMAMAAGPAQAPPAAGAPPMPGQQPIPGPQAIAA